MKLNQLRMISLLIVTLLSTVTGCSQSTTQKKNLGPLQTVQNVDLTRYTGTWYEIANFPQSFQKGCYGTTATYEKREDGRFNVFNRCKSGAVDGPIKNARGRARVVQPETNAKLKVSFFRPFWGDYWIIDLDPNYKYAVVGHPSRDYLWILSRTTNLEPKVYQGIVSRLRAHGYDTARLVKTIH